MLLRGMRLLANALVTPREKSADGERSREASPPRRRERSADKLKFRTVFISDLHLVRDCVMRAVSAVCLSRPVVRNIPPRPSNVAWLRTLAHCRVLAAAYAGTLLSVARQCAPSGVARLC